MLFSLSMIDWLFFKTRVAPNSLSNERFLMFRIARRKQYIVSLLPFNLEFFFCHMGSLLCLVCVRNPYARRKTYIKSRLCYTLRRVLNRIKSFYFDKKLWLGTTYLLVVRTTPNYQFFDVTPKNSSASDLRRIRKNVYESGIVTIFME